MAKMDKSLFTFLKDRKIFNHSGDKHDLKEALTRLESRSQNRLNAKYPRKKARSH
jgi:hypothetical protein